MKVRRAETLGAIATALGRAGAPRKAIFWVTEDMGASPLAPRASQLAQQAAVRAALNADVAVYPVDLLELDAGTLPGESEETTPDDRPDRRTGVTLPIGGSRLTLETDDLSGVSLHRLATETGGAWIQHHNDLAARLADIVRKNNVAYLLAYESPRAHVPGHPRA